MDYNEDIDAEHKFILVQAPELLMKRSDFRNVAELCKERLRRASGDYIKASELPFEDAKQQNPGFKSYQLDHSNFKRWTDYEGESVQRMETLFDQHEIPLVDGWTRENLLSEILLIQGYPLDSTVEDASGFPDNEVREVTTDFFSTRLFVCLDEAVSGSTAERLHGALTTEDTFVCLDSALSDEMKMRLADACTLKVI